MRQLLKSETVLAERESGLGTLDGCRQTQLVEPRAEPPAQPLRRDTGQYGTTPLRKGQTEQTQPLRRGTRPLCTLQSRTKSVQVHGLRITVQEIPATRFGEHKPVLLGRFLIEPATEA
ncbi:hypothetical protein Y717_08820 [Streptomyces scopuliridis RB72]|uniref:Uncharacterized protein n=1 Tax=Streptomyces scopuliridis RB72 TaxID=1440053 RepID=A0A2T7T8C3_9ACTN|nr:hypothetical protein Y717_08820 [Streptomyces scopuliridis RB72]